MAIPGSSPSTKHSEPLDEIEVRIYMWSRNEYKHLDVLNTFFYNSMIDSKGCTSTFERTCILTHLRSIGAYESYPGLYSHQRLRTLDNPFLVKAVYTDSSPELNRKIEYREIGSYLA